MPILITFITLGLVSITTAQTFECPVGAMRGFPEFGTAPCYLYERFQTQFVTAERMCRLSGGHLASINDGFTNAFVSHGGNEAFLIMEEDDFWVGGQNLEDQTKWEWVDGEKWNYTLWDQNQPSQKAEDRCTAMKLIDGKWRAENCFDRKPYVCELGYSNGNGTGHPSTPKWLTTTPSPTKTESWMTTAEQLESTLTTTPVLPTTSEMITSTPEASTTAQETSTVSVKTLPPETTTQTIGQTTFESTPLPTTTELPTTAEETTTELPTTTKLPTTTELPTTVEETTTKLPTTTELPTTVEETTTELPTTTKLPTTTELPTTTTKLHTTTQKLPPTTTSDPDCLPGWHYYGENVGADEMCYKVFSSLGWEKDNAYCKSNNATLVSVHKYPKFLKVLIYENEGNPDENDLTIGLYEVLTKDGVREWAWTDKTPMDYPFWFDNYPKPAKEGEPLRCGISYTSTEKYLPEFGKWKHVRCDSIQQRAVCQQPSPFDPIYDY